MAKKIVFAWGRFNPPTTGHGVVMDRVAKEAIARSADYAIFASKTENPKKDPLSFRDKVKFLKQSFPKHSRIVNSNSKLRTVIQVMQHLENKYDEVTMVVGSDRIMDFKRLLTKYNNKEYNFNKINVVSAGERDPDSEGVSGMSASKMRDAATSGDYDLFKTGTPLKNPKRLYTILRKGMNISEEVEPINELSKAAKLAMGAIAVAALNKRRKKKKLLKKPKVIKKEEPKSLNRLMKGGIGGPRFSRMLRFGLVDSYGEIPITKRAFADLDASQSNPQLRQKIFTVVDRAFDYLLNDDIIYKRMLLLLHKKVLIGENAMGDNYEVCFEISKISESLEKKSNNLSIPYEVLVEVYTRGLYDWKNRETDMSQEQWAYSRVNSFISGGLSQKEYDKDLWTECSKDINFLFEDISNGNE